MQETKMSVMCYYDARIDISVYGGLFNPLTLEPFCTYYSFKAFGELYRLKNQVQCESAEDEVYAAAASNGTENAVLISNISGEDKTVKTNIDGSYKVYVVDEEHFLTEVPLDASEFEIKSNRGVLIKN